MPENQGTLGGQGIGKTPGLTAGAIKYIAIAAMLVDHVAILFVQAYYSPLGSIMHFIGRIAGPVMFFGIAEGYRYTRNANSYTLRLLVFAAVSYLPFIFFFTGRLPTAKTWGLMDVGYTLLLGLLALRARHEVKNPVLSWGGVLLCLVFSTFGDWGYFCVVSIFLFDLLRGDFKRQRMGFCLLVLLVRVLPPLVDAAVAVSSAGAPGPYLAKAFVACGMLLPMGMLSLYNGQRGKTGRWIFYVFYPAHLIIVGVLYRVYLHFSKTLG